uniref:Uncharacterized protein n=1 Tax=Graphocephala atropunctata TaxID=36148 RepID=A0A1B6LX16_9HEMI
MIAVAFAFLIACSAVTAIPRPGPAPRAAPQPRPGPPANGPAPDPYIGGFGGLGGYYGGGLGFGGIGCEYPAYGVTEQFVYSEPPVFLGEEVLIPEVAVFGGYGGGYPYGYGGGFGGLNGGFLY